jgi:GNAT superfamily N-acetyltransferase
VYEVELIARTHARDAFDCGVEALNSYLQHTARQHTERGISRTFVLVQVGAQPPKPVIGYFTINICQVRSEMLPPHLASRLPREISGLRLGRLAVARTHQGQGIGKLLLRQAMRKVLDVFHLSGGIGLFVDAKDDAAKAYYEQFGFIPLRSNPLELFLPLATIEVGFT